MYSLTSRQAATVMIFLPPRISELRILDCSFLHSTRSRIIITEFLYSFTPACKRSVECEREKAFKMAQMSLIVCKLYKSMGRDPNWTVQSISCSAHCVSMKRETRIRTTKRTVKPREHPTRGIFHIIFCFGMVYEKITKNKKSKRVINEVRILEKLDQHTISISFKTINEPLIPTLTRTQWLLSPCPRYTAYFARK